MQSCDGDHGVWFVLCLRRGQQLLHPMPLPPRTLLRFLPCRAQRNETPNGTRASQREQRARRRWGATGSRRNRPGVRTHSRRHADRSVGDGEVACNDDCTRITVERIHYLITTDYIYDHHGKNLVCTSTQHRLCFFWCPRHRVFTFLTFPATDRLLERPGLFRPRYVLLLWILS